MADTAPRAAMMAVLSRRSVVHATEPAPTSFVVLVSLRQSHDRGVVGASSRMLGGHVVELRTSGQSHDGGVVGVSWSHMLVGRGASGQSHVVGGE